MVKSMRVTVKFKYLRKSRALYTIEQLPQQIVHPIINYACLY